MKFGVSLALSHAPKETVDSILEANEIDFVEIALEKYLYRSDSLWKNEVKNILERKEAIGHSYSLSLLDPKPWNENRLNRHKAFFTEFPFTAWSDHFSLTSMNGETYASITPGPAHGEAIELFRTRLNTITQTLPELPFFIENPAMPFFVEEVKPTLGPIVKSLKGTNSKLLLDVSNLVANEINFDISAESEIEQLADVPIGEIHLAGGNWDRGFYRDSHSSPVTDRSWEILERIKHLLNEDTYVLIEREQNYPDVSELIGELNHAKRICGI